MLISGKLNSLLGKQVSLSSPLTAGLDLQQRFMTEQEVPGSSVVKSTGLCHDSGEQVVFNAQCYLLCILYMHVGICLRRTSRSAMFKGYCNYLPKSVSRSFGLSVLSDFRYLFVVLQGKPQHWVSALLHVSVGCPCHGRGVGTR